MLKKYFKSSTEIVLEGKSKALCSYFSLYSLAMISLTKILLYNFLNTSTFKLASTMWVRLDGHSLKSSLLIICKAVIEEIITFVSMYSHPVFPGTSITYTDTIGMKQAL